MPKPIISFLILLIAALLSCKTAPADKVVALDNNTFVRYTYFKNGKTSTEQHFIKDKKGKEFFAGDYNNYYESGKLKTHSTFTVVDSTGVKAKYNEYGTEYYENGFPKNDFNKFENALAGMQVSYFPNGSVHELHYYAGEKISFFMKYDMNGNIIKMNGYPLSASCDRKTIKKGEELGMSYNVVATKNLKNKLKIKVVNPQGQINDTTITNFEKSYNQFTYIEVDRFLLVGKYAFIYEHELSDANSGQILKKTTFSDTITVVK